MPAHASIDVFGVWTHWTQHVCRRGCSAVIHYQRCFAGTFKVRIFKAAVPFCTTMTFRSLKLFVNIKMWDTFTLSTEWYRSFAVKVRSAFLISIPSAFVLHRDIKASSKCAHSRPVLLNKPPPPAVRRLPQFPSATGQLCSTYRFSASSMSGEEQLWREEWHLPALCQPRRSSDLRMLRSGLAETAGTGRGWEALTKLHCTVWT